MQAQQRLRRAYAECMRLRAGARAGEAQAGMARSAGMEVVARVRPGVPAPAIVPRGWCVEAVLRAYSSRAIWHRRREKRRRHREHCPDIRSSTLCYGSECSG